MMQKGKKRVEALRPESPLGRRRSVHNNHAKLNPRTSGPSSQTEVRGMAVLDPLIQEYLEVQWTGDFFNTL